jgi:hypothetical protein
MEKYKFHVNEAMICYYCRHTAVVRLTRSWSEALNISFVSCAACGKLSQVHDPKTATIRRYIDPRFYTATIHSLDHFFKCTSHLLTETKFSLTAWKIMKVTIIRDISELFDIPAVPDQNIKIIENGEELQTNCRFFNHEMPWVVRESDRYPVTSPAIHEKDNSMRFSSAANRPPPLLAFDGLPLGAKLYRGSEDTLPAYSSYPDVLPPYSKV